ncbi:DUF421 domain-containing protein [Dyadobacter sp. CY261]|uniref:DUF421 domain-containing protein n=1 Tax=Dyadobacter sp. CY261 TaxID=2907203 RepID=UPI001F3EF384|nr:YetF domain-containing protein [Dyadobacter sp. CY261]MCF0074079.1 DUF421 domain-containing protein [Dyadobacter sp. CY261]
MPEFADWRKILMHDHPFTFLLEVVIRTVIMFMIILIALRASGKRGIKQLSVFELVLIIGLGSAAGDPMFYEDVGILPAFVVFLVVISLYITVTRLSDRFVKLEKLLEGESLCVIRDGKLLQDAFKDSGLSQDEFFAALRMRNVEHLGQVRTVLIETSGEFSVLYYPDEEVRYGLPIFPDKLKNKLHSHASFEHIACAKCGNTKYGANSTTLPECPECEVSEWVEAINTKRIA